MITYDISDDKVRRQVSQLLLNRGERVQYSLFECYVDAKDFDTFREEIVSRLESGDSVRWYPLCKWCRKQIIWQGSGGVSEDPDYFEV